MNKFWVIAGALSVFVVGVMVMLAATIFMATDKYSRSAYEDSQQVPEVDSPAVASEYLVSSFYEDYIAGKKGWRNDHRVSEDLKGRMRAEQELQVMGGADPVLCAQDFPSSWQLKQILANNQSASFSVQLEYGTSVRPVIVTATKAGAQWQISNIDCSAAQTPVERNTNVSTAIIYFNNAQRVTDDADISCGLVYGVERAVPSGGNYYSDIVKELFKGPSDSEILEGYVSSFSSDTEGALIGVNIKDKTAFINMKDIRDLIPEASTACGGEALLAQIEQTVKDRREIETVVLAIEGDPQTFYEWIQMDCPDGVACDPSLFE